MALWQAPTEETARCRYKGVEVHKPGPWSQGPVFLQQLALLEGFDLAAMGLDSADYLHTVTECAKLAYADREAWYGDPDFTDVPLAALRTPATPGAAGNSSTAGPPPARCGPAHPGTGVRGSHRWAVPSRPAGRTGRASCTTACRP